MLYLFSEVGSGVVVKGGAIFEADNTSAGNNENYLCPWDQFNLVATAKNLVNKGLGTDIVNKVNGDADAITLGVVLEAAGDGDELAEDLVKRSGLALGVRMAYLVNMFNPELVILGGGTEIKQGSFAEYVGESSARFLLDEVSEKIKIIPGVLGAEASSVGAASIARRELFMEV